MIRQAFQCIAHRHSVERAHAPVREIEMKCAGGDAPQAETKPCSL